MTKEEILINKKDILKNLKDIKSLMLCDIFVIDTDNNPEYSNADMWVAISYAIKVFEDMK